MSTPVLLEVDGLTIHLSLQTVLSTDTHITYELVVKREGGETILTKTDSLPLENAYERNPYAAASKKIVLHDMVAESEQESPVFQQFEMIFRKIDQSKFAKQRASNVLELLEFCSTGGLDFIRRHADLQHVVKKKCEEYRETASHYQSIVEKASHVLLLLCEGSRDTPLKREDLPSPRKERLEEIVSSFTSKTLQNYLKILEQSKSILQRRSAGLELFVFLSTECLDDLALLLKNKEYQPIMETIREECKQFMKEYATDEYAYQWAFTAYKMIAIHDMPLLGRKMVVDHDNNLDYLIRRLEDDTSCGTMRQIHIMRILKYVIHHYEEITNDQDHRCPCEDPLQGYSVEEWLEEYKDDKAIVEAVEQYLKIQSAGPSSSSKDPSYDYNSHHC